MTDRPKLRLLAERLGIVSEYVDQTGRSIRRTRDATRETLLAVMGFDAPTEDAAAAWLSELDHEERETMVAPVRIVERDDPAADRVHVRLPSGVGSADVEVTLHEEAGHVWRASQRVQRTATMRLPTRAPYGYHHLTVNVRGAGGEWSADQSLIVVPETCVTPDMLVGKGRRVMGIVANLYAVRREEDWGVGDMTTLTQLVEWANGGSNGGGRTTRGAAFIGINPLHALYNRGVDISPYSPVTRLFRNPIYIDVTRVPELAESPVAQQLLDSAATADALRELRATKQVDYDRVAALKTDVLRELHRHFRERASRGDGSARGREYHDFVRQRDPELTRFATWMAIAEASGTPDWRAWPLPLRDPSSEDVAAFQAAHAAQVDFHRWLQFELQRQLADVALRARVLGMEIGVYQDLAIGTNPGGSDTWTFPELFLEGANLGAPPDPYAPTGQNWGLPVMSPRALAQQRYRYWIQLLRRAFEHTGALRIDHIIGLFRTFWIPEGGTGGDGAYVRFPARDLLGILALESVRHNALVVGEDLGTVPPDVGPALRKWGILSSKVLYFERDRRGFKPASRYPPLALATANTHDLPTIAGFWSERDIELRRAVGLLRSPAEVKKARAERAADKRALLERLRLAPPPRYELAHFARTLTGAVHDFLCSTPSQLVGLSLDDIIGETEPVNVPGVGPEKYASWRRRSRLTVEEMSWSFEVDDTIRCSERRRAPR